MLVKSHESLISDILSTLLTCFCYLNRFLSFRPTVVKSSMSFRATAFLGLMTFLMTVEALIQKSE